MQLLMPGEDVKFSEPADFGGQYGEFMKMKRLLALSLLMPLPTSRSDEAVQTLNTEKLPRWGKSVVSVIMDTARRLGMIFHLDMILASYSLQQRAIPEPAAILFSFSSVATTYSLYL
ncbi:MAG: hypothetical protein FD149_2143 [Rhodospirillaceae bacterium]|nr:MAG: hypothetical protein FD149_2143 [Rhodospirillaceae bacterium]